MLVAFFEVVIIFPSVSKATVASIPSSYLSLTVDVALEALKDLPIIYCLPFSR